MSQDAGISKELDKATKPDNDDLKGACLDIYRYMANTGYSVGALDLEQFKKIAKEYCNNLLELPNRPARYYDNRGGVGFDDVIVFHAGLSTEEKGELAAIATKLSFRETKHPPHPEFVRRKLVEEQEPLIIT